MRFISLFLILASNISFAAGTKISPVVQEIQNTFRAIQTIETDFDQTITSSRFGEKKSSGKLLIQRPGKMIWNYTLPKGRVFAADGNVITLYDPDDNQALVSPQPKGGKLPAGFSFLMGQSNLTEFFNVEVLSDKKNPNGNREVKLFCKPKGESFEFKTLELTFEWLSQIMLTASKTKDMLDSQNEIRFAHMKFNTKLSSRTFDVKLPKGTPVVTNNSLEN